MTARHTCARAVALRDATSEVAAAISVMRSATLRWSHCGSLVIPWNRIFFFFASSCPHFLCSHLMQAGSECERRHRLRDGEHVAVRTYDFQMPEGSGS
jgi:hypothetical protein